MITCHCCKQIHVVSFKRCHLQCSLHISVYACTCLYKFPWLFSVIEKINFCILVLTSVYITFYRSSGDPRFWKFSTPTQMLRTTCSPCTIVSMQTFLRILVGIVFKLFEALLHSTSSFFMQIPLRII